MEAKSGKGSTCLTTVCEQGFYLEVDPADFSQLLYYLRDPTARLPNDLSRLQSLKRLATRYEACGERTHIN